MVIILIHPGWLKSTRPSRACVLSAFADSTNPTVGSVDVPLPMAPWGSQILSRSCGTKYTNAATMHCA